MSVCAVGVPDATLAHDVIIQTNCSALHPLQESLYPAIYCSPQSLDLTPAQLTDISISALMVNTQQVRA